MPIEYVTGRINILLDKAQLRVLAQELCQPGPLPPFRPSRCNDELRPSPTEESDAAPPGPAVVRAGRRGGRDGSSPRRVGGGVNSPSAGGISPYQSPGISPPG